MKTKPKYQNKTPKYQNKTPKKPQKKPNTRPQDKLFFFLQKNQLKPHSKKTFGQP
jgi:hypothetical protein